MQNPENTYFISVSLLLGFLVGLFFSQAIREERILAQC